MRRIFLMKTITGLVVITVALSGCQLSETSEDSQKSNHQNAVPVEVMRIQPETISRYTTLTGRIEAGSDTLVFSKISEQLEQIMVTIGEHVQADQVLAVQSDRLERESVNQAEAVYNSALVQEQLALKSYERSNGLYRDGYLSRQDYDQAESNLKTAQLAVEQAQAQLFLTRTQLNNTSIKAPFNGTIAQILFEVGDMVNAGEAIFKVVNERTFKARLDVPETEINDIVLGLVVIATFPASPGTEFEGRITRIDEAIATNKQALEIEVGFTDNTFENNDSDAKAGHCRLRSGLFGQFKIELERHVGVLTIPDKALLSQTEVRLDERGAQTSHKTFSVFVVEQGRAVSIRVTPGLYESGRREIISGLKHGALVIVSGQNIVRDGSLVVIINPENDPIQE
ncbi:efflux RND transporter periplasmic adaptor subunit [bacterium]|nr:efflux RND transporter periplasmic adaptor subunit [bacterium]